jgi:tyrosyl-tRNA synthetase
MEKKEMTLWEELEWRGLIYQTTLTDPGVLDREKVVFYHGFDASADSQTVGNLASMMLDLCFLRHGHKSIVLAGGATSLIGDAGGRDKERPMQSREVIEHNIECAKKQLQKIYGNYEFVLVNNIDWTVGMDILDFLRDVGKNFNVGEMIKKDYIANRIGEGGNGISFTEFSYSLLQAYDFYILNQRYGCTLQLCGADQWTNCLAGVELIKKKTGAESHVLTNPLIVNRATGKKFGKSEEGAIWLDAAKTTPYRFYQFWLNTDDESVLEYLKIFTSILPEEYNQLIADFQSDTSRRSAQKYLAYAVTAMVHTDAVAEDSKTVSEFLFGEKKLNELSKDQIQMLISTIPSKKYTGESLLDILTTLHEIADSKRAARELITSGAISVEGGKITDEAFVFSDEYFVEDVCIIRKGKKDYFALTL